MMQMRAMTYTLAFDHAKRLGERILAAHTGGDPVYVYGVPTGGACVALMLAQLFPRLCVVGAPCQGCVVVDDIVDSGATRERYADYAFDALVYSKRNAYCPATVTDADVVTEWVQFPWEHVDAPPVDNVRRLLQYIGEDPQREGLLDTPARVVKALREMTCGYGIDPKQVLSTMFSESADELVLLRNIPFVSLCEHHMLPFHGVAHVAYLPGERVVGLSKLARLVDCFAKRLQIQERMTHEITTALMAHLNPRGAAAIVIAHHSCMSCRGVQKSGTEMITSSMLGDFRTCTALRQELLSVINLQGK